MYIVDKNGAKIEVTDLEGAIQQVSAFKDMFHEDPAFEKLDATLKDYYDDIFQKLVALRKTSSKEDS